MITTAQQERNLRDLYLRHAATLVNDPGNRTALAQRDFAHDGLVRLGYTDASFDRLAAEVTR